MDTTYSKAVAYAIPIFVSLILLELAADLWLGKRYYRLADALNSLSCGIVSTGMRVFFGFLGLFFYERLLAYAPVALPADHWGTWVFGFILYDLCYYWNHRWGHTVGVFWASHVVHHQSEEFNLTTALRQSGTGSFLGWIFYLPMALAGVPVSVFLIVGVIQLFYQFWPHTRLIGRLGILDRWIQTPSNHRVHHAQNDRYLDKNYVGVFVIWDHLFGTFQEERDDDPPVYGIRGQLKSWNPVWANLHYYWAMAFDAWQARSWLDKLRVWWEHPGWRPADVAARFPKPAYDLARDFHRFDPPRTLGLSLYAFLQFLVLIWANSHFLSVLTKQSTALNVAYFLYLMAGLVCVGGVLENRVGWLRAEAARLVLTLTGVVAARSWFGTVTDPRLLGGIVGFALLSLGWLAWQSRHRQAQPAPQTA
jgi:sterol desaturase/sphingolipid hydroxylase (fatty acid hydroxylase superfamily)